MKEIEVDLDFKRMLGEFVDCVELVGYNQHKMLSGDPGEVARARAIIDWSQEATAKVVEDAFSDEAGIFKLAYLACCLVANVSNIMFQAEAETSLGGEEE